MIDLDLDDGRVRLGVLGAAGAVFLLFSFLLNARGTISDTELRIASLIVFPIILLVYALATR